MLLNYFTIAVQNLLRRGKVIGGFKSLIQRIREIGIRKVFGANARSVLVLLTRKYILLALFSFLLIFPLNYYPADQWLSGFAYDISISPWLYAEALAIVMMITFLMVSFQSLKAAWTNPSKILRND